MVADQIRVLSEDSRKSGRQYQRNYSDTDRNRQWCGRQYFRGADAAKNSSVQIEDLIGKLDTVNNSAESATVVVKEEYDVIGEVKRQFDDIQEELDTVAATSEENASMVAAIILSIRRIMKLSGSIDSLKESSKKNILMNKNTDLVNYLAQKYRQNKQFCIDESRRGIICGFWYFSYLYAVFNRHVEHAGCVEE